MNIWRCRLQRSFGIQPMKDGAYLPDLVILLNPSENLGAIRECTLKNVPTIGIIDTDIDPRLVTYPIPANMEVRPCVPLTMLLLTTQSVRTAELILGTLSIAGSEGRRLRLQEAEQRGRQRR